MQDKSGPAFPTYELRTEHHAEHGNMPGMTLRDYIAIAAMPHAMEHVYNVGKTTPWQETAALDAYAMADAMLKVRSQ